MRKFFVILLIFSVFSSLPAQEKLTLEKSIQIALQRNTGLIKSQNSLSYSEQRVKSSYGDLIPTLGVRGEWDWSRIKDQGGTYLDYLGNTVTVPASEEDQRNYIISAGGSVVLFDGLANWTKISQAKQDLEADELSLDRLKQDIVYQTTNLYFSVLNSQEILKVRKDNVQYNRKLLETIEERNRLGSVPIADVYTQQYQVGNAELQVITTQNELDVNKNNLLNYLALDVLAEYEFVNPFQGADISALDNYMKEFNDLSAMAAEALNLRLDYRSQKLLLESADDDITIANGGHWPSLSGNYGFSTSSLSVINLFDRQRYSVGLSLSFPIFSQFNTETAVELAQVTYRNTEEDLYALERQIKIDVKQAYQLLVAAKKALDVAVKNVVSTEENRRVNNERYSLGSGTILDVLQSDRDYQDALSSRINAEFIFYKSRDGLLNAIGKLDFNQYE